MDEKLTRINSTVLVINDVSKIAFLGWVQIWLCYPDYGKKREQFIAQMILIFAYLTAPAV